MVNVENFKYLSLHNYIRKLLIMIKLEMYKLKDEYDD